ncbi:MAG TPA: C2H2-type zinc finger protein [Thermoplasmata archaeon]|nr:C2H2-type zinc finger protein [Thermoplasmata archaeon]
MPYVEYDEVEAICPDCGRTFRSEELLAAHRAESHSGLDEPGAATGSDDEVACPNCHHLFASRAALELHRRESHRTRTT